MRHWRSCGLRALFNTSVQYRTGWNRYAIAATVILNASLGPTLALCCSPHWRGTESEAGESQVRTRTTCHILATGWLLERGWIIMDKSDNSGTTRCLQVECVGTDCVECARGCTSCASAKLNGTWFRLLKF